MLGQKMLRKCWDRPNVHRFFRKFELTPKNGVRPVCPYRTCVLGYLIFCPLEGLD